jgi:hypothetical protein
MSQHNSNCESKMDDISHIKTNRILHDIRNMKILSKDQITSIRKMSDQEKMEVILAYDSVMHSINDIVNNM